MRNWHWLWLGILLAMPHPAQACDVADDAFASAWQRLLKCSHPLCGVAINATVPDGAARCDNWHELRGEANGALRDGGVLVLGEIHDNPSHHALRAALIEALSGLQQRPGIVFEQFRTNEQEKLSQAASSIADLKRNVDWDRSGWSKYPYDPLLESVLAAGLPRYAGDAPRDLIRRSAMEREAALPASETARLALATPLGARLDDASVGEIEASHCGLMPKSAFGGMAFAQRVRDATIADTAIEAAAKHGGAIVIAGNGHVRSDRGVPWYIRARKPSLKVVSVMLVEVEHGRTDPWAYAPRDPDGKPAADFIVFTPRIERPDPCDEMKKQFGKKP